MKKDIDFAPVQNVTLAVVRQQTAEKEYEYNVYLLNQNKVPITNVFVTSKGYGEKDGEEQKTSTLRHYFKDLGPDKNALVEPIQDAVFHLNNEYWVSYYIDSQIFDKKFIFVPDSLVEENFTLIPELGKEGVLHV